MSTVLDDTETRTPVPADFPVSESDQLRNVTLFGINTGLMFLGSSVLNVGRFHAAVCKALGASDTVSNLPWSAYLVMAASPLIVACVFPQVSLLKRVLVVCYSLLATMGGLVAVSIVLPLPNSVKIAAIILQGAVTGAALTTVTMFLFEVIGRGAEPAKRGRALSLGYGRGPILGLVAALSLQLCLDGRSFGLTLPSPIPSPWNFALPFAAAVPIMGLAAWLATLFVIPTEEHEPARRPFFSSVFGGVGDFVANRWLLLTFIIGVISFWGFSIGNNMTLYTKEVLGVPPQKLVGYQLALRFGFKIAAGLCLGALLTRSGPRATMLVTALCAAAGIAWAMIVPGYWFLLGFGLLGAGELFGVYMTNYILSCSSKARTRSNMGFASLTMLPAAPAGAILGAISDYFGSAYTRAFGFRLSFAVALGFMALVILLIPFLPAHPERQAEPETISP
jgi:MFS family permease